MKSLPKQMQESYYNGPCRIQRVTINLITHVDMNSTLYCLSVRRTFNSIQHLLTFSIQHSALIYTEGQWQNIFFKSIDVSTIVYTSI